MGYKWHLYLHILAQCSFPSLLLEENLLLPWGTALETAEPLCLSLRPASFGLWKVQAKRLHGPQSDCLLGAVSVPNSSNAGPAGVTSPGCHSLWSLKASKGDTKGRALFSSCFAWWGRWRFRMLWIVLAALLRTWEKGPSTPRWQYVQITLHIFILCRAATVTQPKQAWACDFPLHTKILHSRKKTPTLAYLIRKGRYWKDDRAIRESTCSLRELSSENRHVPREAKPIQQVGTETVCLELF